jgi:hypothetical protein
MVGYRLHPAEFEKDDDTNFHIAFITYCSNLRARNYGILSRRDFFARARVSLCVRSFGVCVGGELYAIPRARARGSCSVLFASPCMSG